MIRTVEAEAHTRVHRALNEHFGPPKTQERSDELYRLVVRIVAELGTLMRPVAEQQVKSNGWLSPDEAHEQALRRTHAGIADYCRHKRLAMEALFSGEDMNPLLAVMFALSLDEQHYARLANLPTHEEEARRIAGSVEAGVIPVPDFMQYLDEAKERQRRGIYAKENTKAE